MNKCFKVAALVAVTAMILTAPVFAQSSNTATATAGVFYGENKTDVDNSLDVHFYSNVEFDKWFGFVGYGTAARPVRLGYATRFGDLYLGTYYTGNFLNIRENWTDTVAITYNLADQDKTQTVTSTAYTAANTIESRNQIQALIGVAGMGFKLKFDERILETTHPTETINITENHNNGNVTYSQGDKIEYSNFIGFLEPTLTWGMSLDLGSMVIRPMVALGATININSVVNEYRTGYTTGNGGDGGSETINRIGNNNGSIVPRINVGAALDFGGSSIDVGYGIDFNIYSNSYDASGFSGSTPGTVNWGTATQTTNTSIATTVTTKNATLTINDQSRINHSINLAYSLNNEIVEGLKLGFKAGIDVTILTTTTDEYTLTLGSTETKYNNAAQSASNTRTETETRTFSDKRETTTFTLRPYVNIGASYALIPERFTVNAGINLNPLGTGYQNILRRRSYMADNGSIQKSNTYNDKGDVTAESVTVTNGTQPRDSVEVDNTWNTLSASFGGGFVFNFTDHLTLDTVFSATPSATFAVDVASLTVLLSVKF